MRIHPAKHHLMMRARYHLAIAGTLLLAHAAILEPCAADFSAANFKRVWAEEFGPGARTNIQSPAYQQVGPISPHPAVARIVVPEGEAVSMGSGTLVDVREGFGVVVTNWHVVRDAKGPIEVIFPGGFTSKARVLKTDADWDLAALVIWQPPVEPVKIASSAPRPGDPLTICGYGPGIYRAVTGRCTQYYAPRENLPQQMVELTAEARQGDSGGPILNSRGELAGVLFGASNGTTLGSFSGRVGQFLESLAPGIGQQTPTTLVSVQNMVQQPHSQREIGHTASSPIDGWNSIDTQAGEDRAVAKAALLEPPSFDEPSNSEPATANMNGDWPTNTTAVAAVSSLTPSPAAPVDGKFERIKSALAAFGLFAIVVMFLKAAG